MKNSKGECRGASSLPLWGVLGDSVCGASHVRGNRGNQDALKWFPAQESAAYAVLSVSDGHGSARYCRSEIGAQLAVDVASNLLAEFMETHRKTENLSVVKSMAEEKLGNLLHRSWAAAVDEHFEQHPFSESELMLLQKNNQHPQHAYGATLVSLLVTPAYALLLQLGDGDVLTVSDDGLVQRPLPADERLFAEETTSLCMEEAWRELRVCFQVLSKSYPALFLVATDGYSNSFSSESDFLSVGGDLLEILQKNGVQYVRENLAAWLKEASNVGSGDDVTLGIVYRSDILKMNKDETEGR